MAKIRIHVALTLGAGPPMVLLHGLGRNGRDFRPLLPWFNDRRTAVWDHRGHGLSQRAPGRYYVVDYAADVVEWLRESDFDNVDLYGHSLGALVALRAAAELPQRVRSIVLEDPPSPAFVANMASSAYCNSFRAMQQLAGSDADVETIAIKLADVRLGPTADAPRLGDVRDAASLRFSAKCLQTVDADVFTALLAGRWLEGYDFEQYVAAVRCPALLMYGDVDRGGMLPEDDARRMGQRLARGTVVCFAGAGHLLHWQRLEETARCVLSFLESL